MFNNQTVSDLGKDAPPSAHILMANICLLVPAQRAPLNESENQIDLYLDHQRAAEEATPWLHFGAEGLSVIAGAKSSPGANLNSSARTWAIERQLKCEPCLWSAVASCTAHKILLIRINAYDAE